MSPSRNDADTITEILDKISSPLVTALLSVHPNDVTLDGTEIPSPWSSWWTWALDYEESHPGRDPAWLLLIRYYNRSSDSDPPEVDIPQDLRSYIDAVRGLQLHRDPCILSTQGIRSADHRCHGMSPKKEHEVHRMSAYIHHLVSSGGSRSVWHAVDVGSGQGYLSRAIQDLDFHVLALDNNENQTSGANRRKTKEAARKLKQERRKHLDGVFENSSSNSRDQSTDKEGTVQSHQSGLQHSSGERKGSLTHRTLHVSPRTLNEAISEWILTDSPGNQIYDGLRINIPPTPVKPVPVMFVALHACGSLTVDVLRTFLSYQTQVPRSDEFGILWRSHSLVVVGCCYNLMSSSDFPLSKPLREMAPTPKLPITALHLAAQVPSQWLKNPQATRDAELAIHKSVYRALLHPIMRMTEPSGQIAENVSPSGQPIQPGLGETPENRRLKKLNNEAYKDWPTFLERATGKLGIDLAAISEPLPDWFTHEATRLKMESALSVLQTLRCILGPLIESLIILDRRDWIRQELTGSNRNGQRMEVDMVNLFDQATGSGRNVALVIKLMKWLAIHLQRPWNGHVKTSFPIFTEIRSTTKPPVRARDNLAANAWLREGMRQGGKWGIR